MEGQSIRYYHFGDFEIDARRRTLSKDGERVDISARNFDLLLFLVENEGRILSHDEMLDAVWEGAFVEQSNLKKGISAIRHILEESPDEAAYIRTIPRRGYSFVAPVTKRSDESPSASVYGSETEILIEETELIEDDGKIHRVSQAGSVRPKWAYFAPAVTMLLVVSGAIWYFLLRSPGGFRFENVRVENLTNDGNCFGKVSPDRNFVLCIMPDGDAGVAIEVLQLATENRRRLFSKQDAAIYATQYSPDGNFVYAVVDNFADRAQSGIYKISILGGEPKMIVQTAGSMIVSSIGNIVFTRVNAAGETELHQVDANGQGEKQIVKFSPEHRLWDFGLTPDETGLLCALRKQLSDTKNVYFVSQIAMEDGSQEVIVPERDTLIADALWMSDMKSLLLAIREANADIRQIWQFFPASGEMRRITNDNTSYRDLNLLKDGRTISAVAETNHAKLWVADDEKLDFRALTPGVQSVSNVFWTPDGRIGYSTVENSAEVIRLITEDGRTREKLGDGRDGYWIQPSLAGDKKGIAYNSLRSGLIQVWRMDLDGKNPRQVTKAETPVFNGRLLSDGSAIYKTSVPSIGWQIIRQLSDGTSKQVAVERSAGAWDISPDESLIAVVSENRKDREATIIVSSIDTSEVSKRIKFPVRGSVELLSWDPDGSAITFVITERGASELYRVLLSGGEPQKITDFRYERVLSLARSLDGRKLAVARGRVFSDTVLIKSN